MVQRGYKAWCEAAAEQYREKLGSKKEAPLCAWKLAEHLNVIVWTPSDIPDIPQKVIDALHRPGKSEWSAATLVTAGKNVVILNGSHGKPRQSHDLMHELSHLIRGHAPARVDFTKDNVLMLHSYDQEQEDEADILAGTLLLPRTALVEIVKGKIPPNTVLATYCVSQQLLTMRLNRTGVNKQFSYQKSR
jgi:Zn-dependent peptidase ImmA (M78 family)